MSRQLTAIDKLICEADTVLRTLSNRGNTAGRPSPAEGHSDTALDETRRRHVAGLMRVNHTGEVCAQALYQGQALTAKLPTVRDEMQQAAEEEVDHLVWTEERLRQLDSRPSVLNPAWYGLSFALGALAGAVGDAVSLGFVAATEERVCAHLRDHAGRHLLARPSPGSQSDIPLRSLVSNRSAVPLHRAAMPCEAMLL